MKIKWVFILVLLIFFVFFGVTRILITLDFKKSLTSLFASNSLQIELISTGFISGNFIIKETVDVKKYIADILEWKDIEGSFERGGEYPFFRMLLKDGKHTINLTLKLNQTTNSVYLKFQTGINHYIIKKSILSKKVIDDMMETMKH